ncbi:multiple coagulation factor deficiency protein 2 homolog [Fopius arisanus]|uniref:Multiple coagulation factor deficiency protein 2 homolog n=1 Tax=Fopius arisanus TaxID=64838 RepID=A0A9R1T6R6_9HYME|nr:PREDICTED: multiple coagulation factor deficiency protein 2 homolog [Fopius arisanus]
MEMFGLIVIGTCLCAVYGFRGPHHPRGSVSHHHYTPQRDVKLTQDTQLLHDTAHLIEDMGDFGNEIDVSKMTEQQLDFYYFQAHDVDNNTKLDGLEMLHAIQHSFHHDEDDHEVVDEASQIPFIVELIDRVLEEDDLDHDGYLGYIEYVLARQKTGGDTEKPQKDLKLEI